MSDLLHWKYFIVFTLWYKFRWDEFVSSLEIPWQKMILRNISRRYLKICLKTISDIYTVLFKLYCHICFSRLDVPLDILMSTKCHFPSNIQDVFNLRRISVPTARITWFLTSVVIHLHNHPWVCLTLGRNNEGTYATIKTKNEKNYTNER